METVIEIILDLFVEGGLEAAQSSRVPRPVRYILAVMLALFFIAVIGIMFIAAIASFKFSILIGIFVLALAVFMLVRTIMMFRKIYLKIFHGR